MCISIYLYVSYIYACKLVFSYVRMMHNTCAYLCMYACMYVCMYQGRI